LEPFQLKQANGRRYDVTPDLQANKVIMVSFWATWCGPCKAEMEKLSPVYDELLGEGFQYLAVSTDGPDSVAEVRPYIRSNDYQFPVLLDTTGKLLERYNPRGDLPYYLLVNRKGQIVEEHQGFVPGDEVGIEARVRALLKAGR
jgi:thiol-disulfide isomerase/thioredoxin